MKPVNITLTNPNPLFPPGTVLNKGLTSAAQQVYNAFSVAIQITITGTPNGSFSLQASCDPFESGVPGYPSNWTPIAGSSQSVAAAGSIMWNIIDPGYNWIQILYTDSSGGTSTAVMSQVTFNSKGF